ncbi:IS3 family transposase [Bacillus thuringiensis]
MRSIHLLCKIAEVSRSGYYKWLKMKHGIVVNHKRVQRLMNRMKLKAIIKKNDLILYQKKHM